MVSRLDGHLPPYVLRGVQPVIPGTLSIIAVALCIVGVTVGVIYARRFASRLAALERETRHTRDWTDAVDAMLGLVDRPALRLVSTPRHRARAQRPHSRAVYSSVVLALVGGTIFVGAPDRIGTYIAPTRTPIPTTRPPDQPMAVQQQIRPGLTDGTWVPESPSPPPVPRSPTAVPSPRLSPTEAPSPPPPASPTPTPTCSPDLPDLIPDLIPG